MNFLKILSKIWHKTASKKESLERFEKLESGVILYKMPIAWFVSLLHHNQDVKNLLDHLPIDQKNDVVRELSFKLHGMTGYINSVKDIPDKAAKFDLENKYD